MSLTEKSSKEGNKKILIIAPQPFFAERGTPLNVRNMLTFLAELGYRIKLLVYPIGSDLNIPNVEVIRGYNFFGIKEIPIGPSWRKAMLDFMLFLRALPLMFGGYAVFHGIEEGAWIAGLFGLLVRRPYIVDMDSCMEEQLASGGCFGTGLFIGLFLLIEQFFLKRATGVLTVCATITAKAKNIARRAIISQIEDIPVSSANEIDRVLLARLRSDWGLNDKKVIVYTGNYQPYQGVDLLLKGFAHLKSSGTCRDFGKIVIVLVGGDGEKDPLMMNMKALAKELGIADQILFIGPRPLGEMGTVMALGDALVSPRSIGGNTPLKVYSYMAAEKPIIATNLATHTQVLTAETAFLATPSPEGLAEQIGFVFDGMNAAKVEQVARAAKALVETRYSAQAFKNRLAKLYSDVVENYARG